jgi:DICT domain-containing protein
MQNLSLYCAIANRYHHLRMLRTTSMMCRISHQIEQQILRYRMPVDLSVGFQRFSYFLPQLASYRQLARVCQRITVFGVPDAAVPTIPGIEFVALSPTAPLAYEWLLLVDAPEFWTLMSALEVNVYGSTQRQFDGVWTFDAPVVESASRLIKTALQSVYSPIQDRYPVLQRQNVGDVTGGLLNFGEPEIRI